VKVFGSEVLDYVVDQTVQTYGGYGYCAEYPAERFYRDSRINRIFEGTNEINRLLIPGMMLRRALKGELPLYEAAMKLQEELLEPAFGEPPEDEFERLYGYVDNLKKLALMTAGIAAQKFGEKIVKEEEVLLRVADLAIAAYAAESALLRAKKRGDALSFLATEYYLTEAMDKASTEAQALLPYLEEGSDLRMLMSAARRLTKHDPVDRIGIQKKVAEAVLEAEGYPF
jgi:alkylation response protein AidB-like acyl-CoA dehydrogenase